MSSLTEKIASLFGRKKLPDLTTDTAMHAPTTNTILNYSSFVEPIAKTGFPEDSENGDGVRYINIWANGETELGRALAQFTYSPFTHPHFGTFNSMEGFWHWLRAEEKDDTLRTLAGFDAKKYGKSLTNRYVENFIDIIIEANFYKIEQNPNLKEMFINSTLPFEFYYLTGDTAVVTRSKGYDWQIAGFEQIRTWMKEGKRPPVVKY